MANIGTLLFTVSLCFAASTKNIDAVPSPRIKIVDSVDDPRYVFIVFGDCSMKVKKTDLQHVPETVVDIFITKCLPEEK